MGEDEEEWEEEEEEEEVKEKGIEEKEGKRKEEEEKKAKLEEQKIKSSLFQRLFQRSQSRPAEEGGEEDQEMVEADLPPPPPPHQPSYLSQVSIDAQLNDLEQLIQSGELERLDSVVSEFTSQYPAESGKQEQPDCGAAQPQPTPAVQT